MEQEAVVLWRVDELRHKLESTRRESQDQSAEAMGAREAEWLMVERETTAKQKLHAAHAHLVGTEAAL